VVGLVGLVKLNGLGLVGSSTLADCWIIGLVICGISGFGGLSLVGVVVLIGLVNLIDFIGLDGLNSLINFCGLVGLISISGLVSIVGLINHISLVGLGIFSDISGLVGQISLISLGELGITSLVGSSALSARQLIGLVGFTIRSLATALIAAKTILLLWLEHKASHRVAAALRMSASKIINAATAYYAPSLLHVRTFVREKMCWWLALAKKKMWLWIASFGESYNGDVLQLAEQLFSLSLPQMTKYCVMRECENIHSWISLVDDLAFSHQQEFTVLNSQKGFWRSLLPEISLLSFTLFLN
jgi:hypothetical protein